ncbi:hypothetical protein HY638_02735 [Candidatus Woesearchaeota archaeon]|nr:hypothetical protein [Candidatus Woesearchaeota archaeon]
MAKTKYRKISEKERKRLDSELDEKSDRKMLPELYSELAVLGLPSKLEQRVADHILMKGAHIHGGREKLSHDIVYRVEHSHPLLMVGLRFSLEINTFHCLNTQLAQYNLIAKEYCGIPLDEVEILRKPYKPSDDVVFKCVQIDEGERGWIHSVENARIHCERGELDKIYELDVCVGELIFPERFDVGHYSDCMHRNECLQNQCRTLPAKEFAERVRIATGKVIHYFPKPIDFSEVEMVLLPYCPNIHHS